MVEPEVNEAGFFSPGQGEFCWALSIVPYSSARRMTIIFFIAEAKLVIELDGSQHYTEKSVAYDAERDRFLADCGLQVIRYSNYDVNTNFEGVCLDIMKHIKERGR